MDIRQVTGYLVVAIIAVLATLAAKSLLIDKKLLLDTTQPRARNEMTIEYAVNADETNLEITAPDLDNCTNQGVKSGCFRIKKKNTGLVKYEFNANDDWVLKQFTICEGETKITTSCNTDLTLDEKLEFFIMDDNTGQTVLLTPSTGVVDLASSRRGA
jgi:myo-inositol-hexaphosphate 3-phosphohydrolase